MSTFLVMSRNRLKKKSSRGTPKKKLRQKSSCPRRLSPLAKTLREHGIPPGLEYLVILDQLIAVEEWEVDSDHAVFSRWRKNCRSRYTLKNSAGQTIFYVVEQQLSAEELSSGRRTMSILVLNHHGHVVLHAHTTTTYSAFCWPLARLEVVASKGRPMGSVQQTFRWCCSKPVFKVDRNNKTVMCFVAPNNRCPLDAIDAAPPAEDTARHIELLTNDNEKIGYVTRDFPGLFNDVYGNSVVGGVKFPADMHVHMKAVLLASIFFFDKLYPQSRKEEKRSTAGNISKPNLGKQV